MFLRLCYLRVLGFLDFLDLAGPSRPAQARPCQTDSAENNEKQKKNMEMTATKTHKCSLCFMMPVCLFQHVSFGVSWCSSLSWCGWIVLVNSRVQPCKPDWTDQKHQSQISDFEGSRYNGTITKAREVPHIWCRAHCIPL